MEADDQVEPAVEVAGIGTDPVMFERFYRQHVELVQSFVARRVSNPCLVADLTADVFLAAAEYRRGQRADLAAGRLAARALGIAGAAARVRLYRARRLLRNQRGRCAGQHHPGHAHGRLETCAGAVGAGQCRPGNAAGPLPAGERRDR